MSKYITTTQINYIANLLKDKIEISDIKNLKIRNILNSIDSFNTLNAEIEDITSVLKFDFSSTDSKSDGITLTPISIVKYMYEEVLSLDLKYITKYKVADLSVGNGSFFIGLIILLKERFPNISVVDIIENNLYGYDIRKENIFFAKLNLYLIALYYGENPENISFNLFEVDTLKHFHENDTDIKFDLIVGNPPYVKQQNIALPYRKFLINNFETIYSNYNLYYAFLELSVELLTKEGVSLQLVPNYLLKIKSAKNLREYLLKDNYIRKIVNFNSSKLFDGIDTYSMIIELGAINKNEDILYKSMSNHEVSPSTIRTKEWKVLSQSNITLDSINLVDDHEEEMVHNVQSQLYTLDISTGIATQKDKLFLIDDSSIIDGKYMTKYFNDEKYLIEKESVVRIYKGSGQSKNNLNYSYIIYPYHLEENKAILKDTQYLSTEEPNTFKYFLDAKDELCKRSGIKEQDNRWYRYGRTQSLNRFETKIIFPTNTLQPNFNLIEDHALFFNGYAIYGLKGNITTLKEFKTLEIILNSVLMEKFMLATSYFIGSGYVSYQKKYIEKFTIPFLDNDQINNIIELNKSDDNYLLNKYIFELYNLDYSDFIQPSLNKVQNFI